MSQENVEVVRRLYETANETYARIDAIQKAHESRDFSEFLSAAEETLTHDVVLRTPEDSNFPDTGTGEWHGHEGFLRFVAGQTEGFAEMSVETQEFIDVGDKVVVPIEFGGRARHTGIEIKFPVVHVVTIRDGKIARLDIHLSKAEALEAAGLSE
jgi:ketosteroid isomerase-like protein